METETDFWQGEENEDERNNIFYGLCSQVEEELGSVLEQFSRYIFPKGDPRGGKKKRDLRPYVDFMSHALSSSRGWKEEGDGEWFGIEQF